MFWNVFTDVVDHIPQKRILRPWNQQEAVCLHGKLHTQNSRTSGASRHRDHEGTPAWTMTNFHQPGEPTEKYTDLFGHGYTIDLYNSPVSLGRAVCNRNEAFKQHRMIKASSSPGRWHQSSERRSSIARINTRSREIARASHFMRRGWGGLWYLSSKLRGNMATRMGIALDSNFDLHLVRKILIVKSQIC